jgi:hydroxyacylglutathione hydrolase
LIPWSKKLELLSFTETSRLKKQNRLRNSPGNLTAFLSMGISLEDGYIDVINKAQRGWQIADHELAERSGLSLDQVQELKNGKFDVVTLESVSHLLRLNPKALLALAEGKYQPEVTSPAGLAVFNSPFEDYTVNSYLVWDLVTRQAMIFDTGADATELLATIAREKLEISYILITHTDSDHIFELDRVVEKTRAPAFVPAGETFDGIATFEAGSIFRTGDLIVETLLTNGHSPGGVSFLIHGLARPVAIVGDSLFAGSMGGAAHAWELALKNNFDKILRLPLETVLCPGHGPLTTVALELTNNPFLSMP